MSSGQGIRISGVLCRTGQRVVELAPASACEWREQLDEAQAGVDRVVEAEPAIGEEHVPRHLAGERRLLLLHLRLDERVADLPHDGPAAEARDLVEQRLAALHLADEGGARLPRQDLAREQHDQLIAPEDSPLAVDGADPIGVAVERDPHLGAASPSRAR